MAVSSKSLSDRFFLTPSLSCLPRLYRPKFRTQNKMQDTGEKEKE